MSLSLGNIWSSEKKNNRKIFTQPTVQRRVQKVLTVNKPIKVREGTRKSWGNATWFMFHSIAAKINKDWYAQNYKFVWDFIKNCCANLPCPFCRDHAVNYIKHIQMTQINTKEKLIQYMFDFHNSVNSRVRNPIYKWDELSKYNNANMNNIFRNFEINFFKMYYNHKEFNGWIRNKFKDQYIKFLNVTRHHYHN